MDSLAALGLRRAPVAALIMWRTGLRVGETVALEWRDIDLTAGSLLVRRGKGGTGRTVPLHPDLASLFANWPTSYGPRDLVAGLTKLKPRWDVHLSGDDDQLGYAGESLSSVLGE